MASRGLLFAPVETFSIFLTVSMDAGSNTCASVCVDTSKYYPLN